MKRINETNFRRIIVTEAGSEGYLLFKTDTNAD